MKIYDLLAIAAYFGALIILTPVLGNYMAKVFSGKNFKLKGLFRWFENIIYKTCAIDSDEQRNTFVL